jgi:hypothetical protein
VRTIVYVTAVECGGLYAWQRLTRGRRATLGAACLVVKEVFESGILLLIFVRGPQQRYDPADPAVADHLRKSQLAAAAAFVSEIVIWLLSDALADETGWPVAGGFLLVSMHLKHELEAATVLDEPFAAQFDAPRVVVGSLSEFLGGLTFLRLMRAKRRSPAAKALLAGIGLEHILFIDAVQSEMERRDICLPKTPGRGVSD